MLDRSHPADLRPKAHARRLSLILALLALVAAGCGGGGGETEAPPPGCDMIPDVGADDAQQPPVVQPLASDARVTLQFVTSEGRFTVGLDPAAAPCGAAYVAQLAEQDFYDGIRFHRIVPGFVIQAGDPTGTGTQGAGFTTLDEVAPDTRYGKGVVAMAKAAQDPPGTSGSQFFVVTAADAQLPPEYTVIGRVTAGMAVVERIGRLGGPDERPTRPVTIRDVVVRR